MVIGSSFVTEGLRGSAWSNKQFTIFFSSFSFSLFLFGFVPRVEYRGGGGGVIVGWLIKVSLVRDLRKLNLHTFSIK